MWQQGLFTTGQEDNVEVMVKYFLWDRKVHVPCTSSSGHISVTWRQICLKSDKRWIHLIVCQEEWLWATCEDNLSLSNLSLMTSQRCLPFCVKLMLLQDKMCKEQNVRRYGFSFSRGALLATIFLCDFRQVSLGQHLLKYNSHFPRIMVMLGFHYLTLRKKL